MLLWKNCSFRKLKSVVAPARFLLDGISVEGERWFIYGAGSPVH